MRHGERGECAVFGPFVVLYLFLGGCSAGVLLVSSLWSFAFHLGTDRTRPETDAFRALRNRSFAVGFVVACLAALCLLADLGRPERFVLLFLRPSATSVIAFGTFVLAGMIAVSGFLAIANNFYAPRVSARMKAAAEIICAILAVAVMTYTGVYLQSTKAVAFWDTLLVPILFVLSAVSSGVAIVVILAAFMRDSWRIDFGLIRLHGIHIVVLVLEAFALAAFAYVSATGRGEAPSSLALLFAGDLRVWFVGGVCNASIIVPLGSEITCALLRRTRTFPLPDALCLFGGYALRYCLVAAGLH